MSEDDQSEPAPVIPIPEWPDDPMAMLNKMLAEQSASLHLMFYDLRDYGASIFPDAPGYAQAYIRLALRAQSNCRAALETIARADQADRVGRAARQGDADDRA
ncbi:hypothetical protein ASE00_14285 [Sphingomonas sp. Root710]|nr:hypothetical protein ASE00_14285 [Sphingomonas sp. Root710]